VALYSVGHEFESHTLFDTVGGEGSDSRTKRPLVLGLGKVLWIGATIAQVKSAHAARMVVLLAVFVVRNALSEHRCIWYTCLKRGVRMYDADDLLPPEIVSWLITKLQEFRLSSGHGYVKLRLQDGHIITKGTYLDEKHDKRTRYRTKNR
jgi:hypothetical protein